MSCFVMRRRTTLVSRPAGPCRGGRRAMCLEMSCFVMVPYAHGSYPAVGPGMKLSFRSGFRALRPVLSLGVSGMGLSSRSRFVPFASPPRSCGSALFRAYRNVRTRAAFRVGARFARLIARAKSADAPLPSAPAGLYGPRCRSLRRKKGGSGNRLSLFLSYHAFPPVKLLGGPTLKNFRNFTETATTTNRTPSRPCENQPSTGRPPRRVPRRRARSSRRGRGRGSGSFPRPCVPSARRWGRSSRCSGCRRGR